MGISFEVAAKASEVEEGEDVVDVPIEGVVYKARRPTVAQSALLSASFTGTGVARLNAIFDTIQALMGDEAVAHVKRLVWARRIDLDDLYGGSEKNPNGGLVDQIIAEFANRPTEPSTDSSEQPDESGRRFRGRSAGRGSTLSVSESTSSSTSSTTGQPSESPRE